MSRQFLERMSTLESPGGILEALFHGSSDSEALPTVIAPSHPAHYGTMDISLLAELAWSISQKGLSTLRFNFRGVGASTALAEPNWDDVPALMPDLEEDLLIAMDRQLENHPGSKILLVGYGLGGNAALNIAMRSTDLVHRLVLISPLAEFLADVDGLEVPTALVQGIKQESRVDNRWEPGVERIWISEADERYERGMTEAGRAVADFLCQST